MVICDFDEQIKSEKMKLPIADSEAMTWQRVLGRVSFINCDPVFLRVK